jgi:hypothetical protein
MAAWGPLDVGQLHGAASGDPGLQPAAAPADAPNDYGRRGSDVEDEADHVVLRSAFLLACLTLKEADAAYTAVRVEG